MDYLDYYHLKNTKFYFWGPDSLNASQKGEGNNFSLSHFLSYDYPIYYKFNSRGFRDSEWPEDLSDVIWCIGDSYTAGVGVPLKHTWPSILQHKTNKRCLNLGIHGASNQLLRNMCLQILKDFNPSTIVVMWSFFWRRHKDPWELLHTTNSSENEDSANFLDCYNEVNSLSNNCNIINLIIPLQNHDFDNLFQSKIIDFGRDNLHFDYKTAEAYVEHILSKLT